MTTPGPSPDQGTTPAPASTSTVSAFFSRKEDVDATLSVLVGAGVPRDLIEVVVSAEANRVHYRGRAKRRGSQAIRFGGLGALAGLLLGAIVSIDLILISSGDLPGHGLWIAQLLGPNVGMMLGGILGFFAGLFVRRPVDGVLSRAAGTQDILLVVHHQPAERLPLVLDLLKAANARDALTEPEPRRRSRWW